MLVKTSDLVESFNQWASQLATPNDLTNWVSIDGKCLRSTCKNSENSYPNFVSIVSLFSPTSGWVLNLQNFQNKKSSEIGQVQELVRNYPLSGKVFTLDALHGVKKRQLL